MGRMGRTLPADYARTMKIQRTLERLLLALVMTVAARLAERWLIRAVRRRERAAAL